MRINDLLVIKKINNELCLIKDRCSIFLEQSRGQPLLKNLSCNYQDFDKVKVRKRKDNCEFAEAFNEAFETQHPGLRQRAVFANGAPSFEPADDPNLEPFFIFPVDGFKFMYSREVKNSGQEYKQVFETLFEQFGEEKGNEVITDLLRFTYTSDNLHEGIASGSEIIIYGIPFFYVVRCSKVEDYQDLMSTIKQIC
jgi:hypothetical protein